MNFCSRLIQKSFVKNVFLLLSLMIGPILLLISNAYFPSGPLPLISSLIRFSIYAVVFLVFSQLIIKKLIPTISRLFAWSLSIVGLILMSIFVSECVESLLENMDYFSSCKGILSGYEGGCRLIGFDVVFFWCCNAHILCWQFFV
jgi:hypothetical protein